MTDSRAVTTSSSRGGVTVIAVSGELLNPGAAESGERGGDALASGGATGTSVGDWRSVLEAHVLGAPGEVVVDLSGVTGWGTEAQAVLLRLVRQERAAGRVVSVQALTGVVARQAHDSGMAGLLTADDSGPAWLTGMAVPVLANRTRRTVQPTRDDSPSGGSPRAMGQKGSSGWD